MEVEHTVPLQQVRATMDQCAEALEKEVAQCTAVERNVAPNVVELEAKGHIHAKTTPTKGKKARRKFRLVLCGNHVECDDGSFRRSSCSYSLVGPMNAMPQPGDDLQDRTNRPHP